MGEKIIYKTEEDIAGIRRACHLAKALLEEAKKWIEPGRSTLELSHYLHELTLAAGAQSAPLGYHGFPQAICTSRNHVICHGIPKKDEILQEGDILSVDVSPILGGWHGDSCRTFPIGKTKDRAMELIAVTENSLLQGIEAASKPQAKLGDIGWSIQSYAEKHGFSVVRDFVGHGIGKNFHEAPQVFHYGFPGKGIEIRAGMVFTIEPMINEGTWKCLILEDGWTAITKDGKLSAQFEHTVAIHEDGSLEVLTA